MVIVLNPGGDTKPQPRQAGSNAHRLSSSGSSASPDSVPPPAYQPALFKHTRVGSSDIRENDATTSYPNNNASYGLVKTSPEIYRKPKRFSRTCKIATGIIVVAYLLITTSLLILFWTGLFAPPDGFMFHHLQFPASHVPQIILPPLTRPPGAPPEDGYAEKCDDWLIHRTSPPPMPAGEPKPAYPLHLDWLAYNLSSSSPASPIKLFVYTSGPSHVSGSFTVVVDDEVNEPVVRVQRKTRTLQTLHSTTVCLMRHADRVGLGIYTAEADVYDLPKFTIVLHLPNISFVEELVTRLPYFSQSVGLSDTIMRCRFGLLRLEGDFSPMHIAGLNVTSDKVEAITSSSPIYGAFTTSESLLLQTSQAAIDVNVTLVRESPSSPPVRVTFVTENAILKSIITLESPPSALILDPSSHSDFIISATSANAPVSVVVNHSSTCAQSKVDVVATSEHAPVVVSMDPKYQGSFTISSGVGAHVEYAPGVRDPEDQGRIRRIIIDEESPDLTKLRGRVQWESYNDSFAPTPRMGSVSLTTRSAMAMLYLQESCFMSSCTNGSGLPLF